MTNSINPNKLQQKLIKTTCEGCKKELLALVEVLKKDGSTLRYLSIKHGVQYRDKNDQSKLVVMCDMCNTKLQVEKQKLMEEQEKLKQEPKEIITEPQVVQSPEEQIQQTKYISFFLRSGEKLTITNVKVAILDRNRMTVTDDRGITISGYMETFETNLDMMRDVIRND